MGACQGHKQEADLDPALARVADLQKPNVFTAELKFPMYVVPLQIFMGMTEVKPFEVLMQEQVLVKYQPHMGDLHCSWSIFGMSLLRALMLRALCQVMPFSFHTSGPGGTTPIHIFGSYESCRAPWQISRGAGGNRWLVLVLACFPQMRCSWCINNRS